MLVWWQEVSKKESKQSAPSLQLHVSLDCLIWASLLTTDRLDLCSSSSRSATKVVAEDVFDLHGIRSIEYSQLTNSVNCFACRHFCSKESITESFTVIGFKNWKKSSLYYWWLPAARHKCATFERNGSLVQV